MTPFFFFFFGSVSRDGAVIVLHVFTIHVEY